MREIHLKNLAKNHSWFWTFIYVFASLKRSEFVKMSCHLFTSLMIVALTSSSYGFIMRLGSCPRVQAMPTFQLDEFLGEWYVIQRFNPLCTCAKITIEKGSEGNYSITEENSPFGLHLLKNLRGNRASTLTFPKNGSQAIFKIHGNLEPLRPTTYGIVDTDYKNYAVIWGCNRFLLANVQNADILSRTRHLDIEMIKSARSKLEKLGVNLRPLVDTVQSNCNGSSDGSNIELDNEDEDFDNIVIGE